MPTDLAAAVTDPPRARDRRRSELWAALGCFISFVLVCVVFVWTPAGQRVDSALLPRAERGRGYVQDPVLSGPAEDLLRLVGNPLHVAVALVAVVLAGLVSRRLSAGVAGAAVLLGSVLATRVLKELITRPDLDVIGSTTHNSFPSGHVAAAAGMVFAVLLLAPPRARPWLAILGAVGVAVVIGATMVAGWHRLSDGLGSVLLAATLYFLAMALTCRVAARRAA